MLASERPSDTIFELKKDVSTPDRYMKAGIQKTKADWEEIFPKAFIFNNSEWFIDMTPIEPFDYDAANGISPERRVMMTIVDDVFAKRELCSMSYKDAAIEAIEIYKKRGVTAGKKFGLNEPDKISEKDFRNFIRAQHLSTKWEKYLKINNLLA